MSGKRVEVEQGQSAESLAYENGHFVDTVWQHAENKVLREKRKNPHILFPKDSLFIPDIEPKKADAATDKRHRFRRRGVPSKITFQLHAVLGETLSGVPYRLELATGEVLTGTTGEDGKITAPLLADVETGTVYLEWKGEQYEIALGMRALDPIDQMEGVQKRLQNLGLYTGEIDGMYTQQTIWAVQQFQLRAGLPTTGGIDDETKAKLVEVHGC